MEFSVRIFLNPIMNRTSKSWISGYFWGVEGLSKDFLKPEEKEFGVGHPA
jgi:hypothetical protein